MPTHFTGSRAEMRTLDTFIKLTRCTNALLSRLAERNTIGDLTYSQFAVLEALYHLGPMTAGEVSQKVLKSGSNMTLVIDNLERDGLVRRERDAQDRRVIRVVGDLSNDELAAQALDLPSHAFSAASR